MKSLIAFIMLWISSETDYNTLLQHPNIVMVDSTELTRMYYGHNDSNQHSEVHALYNSDTETIYLRDTFNPYNVWDKGVLMHELMHYVHHKNNAVGTKFKCMAESEAEIYPLQKKYLWEVHGVEWKYDPMYVKVISSCDKK